MAMQTIELSEYNIYLGNIWETFNQFLDKKQYSKIALFVDENTGRDCLPLFSEKADCQSFIKIIISAGERYKTIETCRAIWQKMMDANLDRHALIVNLGGGLIGDMGGFCASTFKRGVDFVQMPTTLLSQVDASIGGKLGIDFDGVKNGIGLFKNPRAVFIEPRFLKTLPRREIRSGFAEIIKHSLIADAGQWAQIQKIENLDLVNWEDFLKPSLLIKKRIVEEDPFEKGLRKALNFGHTVGHAVEGHFFQTDNPFLHGEAVAVGMICEAWLAHKTAGLPYDELDKIARFIFRFYDGRPLNKKDFPHLMGLMARDKKNENETINFTLINPVGHALINQNCDRELILASLDFYSRCIERI